MANMSMLLLKSDVLVIQSYGRKETEMADITILNDIKSKLGVIAEDNSFDSDIVDNIGMAIAELHQIGIGNDIEIDNNTTYSQLFKTTESNQTRMLSKTYIKLSTKVIFDTPVSGAANANDNAAIAQIFWRAGVSVTNIDEPK